MKSAQIAEVHPVPLPGCPDRRDAAATHGRGELGQACGQGSMGWMEISAVQNDVNGRFFLNGI